MNIKYAVKQILDERPTTRDNDFELFFFVLVLLNYDVEKKTTKDFLLDMKEGIIPHFESVRRTRQQWQEDMPYLQGENYELRQRYGKHVRKTINE